MESIRPVNINLDLAKESYNNILLKQGDTTKLIFSIYENGVITNLTDNSFSIICLKPNGSIVQQSSGFITTSVAGGIVSVVLLADCVSSAGSGTIELEIKDASGNRVSSFVIYYSIKATKLGGTPSEAVTTYIEELETLRTNYINASVITRPVRRLYTATVDNTTTFVLESGLYDSTVDVMMITYQGMLLEKDINYSYDIATRTITLGWGLTTGETITVIVIKSMPNI